MIIRGPFAVEVNELAEQLVPRIQMLFQDVEETPAAQTAVILQMLHIHLTMLSEAINTTGGDRPSSSLREEARVLVAEWMVFGTKLMLYLSRLHADVEGYTMPEVPTV